MNIIKRHSPNINVGRNGQVPDMIVCHITEGAFDGAVSWLTNPQSRVSAHFVVARDGRVAQLVDIADTAWANGTSTNTGSNLWHGHSTLEVVRSRGINVNRYTVSIEHEGFHAQTRGALAPAQLEATIQLIAHIRDEVRCRYGKEIPLTRQNLVGHHEITPRTRAHCPGEHFPFEEILRRLGAQGQNLSHPSPHTPSPFAQAGWEWAVSNHLTDGTNPTHPTTREQVATMLMRYDRLRNVG